MTESSKIRWRLEQRSPLFGRPLVISRDTLFIPATPRHSREGGNPLNLKRWLLNCKNHYSK